MREDIIVGARFPDYELEDQAGVFRKLSELQGGNPMVFHLSRGSYDPKEHRFLRNLVNSYPEFCVAYTRLVVISTDNPLNLSEFRDSLGASWPLLGDPERTVQLDLGIGEFTDPHNPVIPYTFALEPVLRIFRIHDGYWYWVRPTMVELPVDLRTLLRTIRPDFDLGAQGLREVWDRGDREIFLVDTLDPPIRFTEGGTVGIKRGGL
jgi:peroxiredoxin